jgi:hypothetical protein
VNTDRYMPTDERQPEDMATYGSRADAWDIACDEYRDTTPPRDAAWDAAVMQAFNEKLRDARVNIAERALEILETVRPARVSLLRRQAF